MEKASDVLLAFALLLALAIAGSGLYTDARIVADWNEKDVFRPMNLSGNSAGRYSKVSAEVWNVAYDKDIDQPMNLSGNSVGPKFDKDVDQPMNLSGNSVGPKFDKDVDQPMNLSGNSVGPKFEVSVEEKSANENEEGWDVNVSIPPGFGTMNAMQDYVRVQCQHSYPDVRPLLLDETLHIGDSLSSPLYVIDPESTHVRYQCIWAIPFTDQYVRRTVWADDSHQNDMPFYCVYCSWKIQDDGIYLFNSNVQAYTKVTNWCTLESGC